ncbi:hypothetical protein R1flu_025342 [Riccia fluitans]|uniref:Uncharacterized protein n=1 Tax=Riccia fluitans TaxID=41844 RepID=A0ABD1XXH0_9MARC
MIEEVDVHAVVRTRVHAREHVIVGEETVAEGWRMRKWKGEGDRRSESPQGAAHFLLKLSTLWRIVLRSDYSFRVPAHLLQGLYSKPAKRWRDEQLSDVQCQPGNTPAGEAEGGPPSVNPGFATRATRSSPGKSAARDTSSEDEEQEEEEEEDDEEGEDQDEDEDDEPTDTEDYVGKQGTNGMVDSRGARRMEEDNDINDLDFIPFRPSRPKEEPRRAPLREPPPPSSDGGIYLARRSLLTVNGAVARTRSGNSMASQEPGLGSARGLAQDGRGLSSDNLLATLAEVAESSGISKPSREQPQFGASGHSQGGDTARGRDNIGYDRRAIETRPSSAVTQALDTPSLRASPPRAKRSSPQLQRNPSLKFANGGVERAAIFMHPNSHANGSPLASTSFGATSCGIWFALQAARNQADNPLPQLSSPYLRIKDGKLPVSHVKKYLVKKLGLANETEVEITCRGQPVVSSLPLESVRNIWFATASGPSTKDQDNQGQASKEASEDSKRQLVIRKMQLTNEAFVHGVTPAHSAG